MHFWCYVSFFCYYSRLDYINIVNLKFLFVLGSGRETAVRLVVRGEVRLPVGTLGASPLDGPPGGPQDVVLLGHMHIGEYTQNVAFLSSCRRGPGWLGVLRHLQRN